MCGFVVGQRWRSEMEPELGVGIVDAVDGRRIHLRFPQGDLVRIYAAGSAPLQRVVFNPGDRVVDEQGRALIITGVEHEAGLMVYCGDGRRLREDRLGGTLVLDAPRERLMAGQREASRLFDLRCRLVDARCQRLRSAAHGFVGGRVDLIAHQFAIAATVCDRRFPRVLLADETGLGKTIEAGLILHRLAAIGRVSRVLVVVPDALVVQWFVELARRFNLRFRIVDDDTLREQASRGGADHPFADEPLVLCGFSRLSGAPADFLERWIHGGWDLVIVDEAHHMHPGDRLSNAVRRLSTAVPRMLLITATPGHLAERSHFARLQLLDPVRYPDYGQFRRESDAFAAIAGMAEQLDAADPLSPATVSALAALLAEPETDIRRQTGDAGGRRRLVRRIVDRHGTGRVMFKTTRRTVGGFPGRSVHLIPLDPVDGAMIRRLNREFRDDCGPAPADGATLPDDDPRVAWLADFLRHGNRDKTLLICRSEAKVNALYDALARRINIRMGRYHEGMSLVQRDRNAAWFAEPEGAVLLLCSEIGSEGRNFQFARHLILFDLPADADLLEQRIGRLDRIGQRGVVRVTVPFVRGTGGEVLARWYHEALNAIAANVPAAGWVTRRLIGPLTGLVGDSEHPFDPGRLARLIRCGRLAVARQQRRIDAGRDRLLALETLPRDAVRDLMRDIHAVDADPRFPGLVGQLFEVLGIAMEEIAPAIFRLTPDHGYADPLPGFRPSGMAVTTDRAIALSREDLDFLTWDHPLVIAAMDNFLGTGKGNTAFVHLAGTGTPQLFLEMRFILEAVAASRHFVQGFLPPTPIRVVVDHRLGDGDAQLAEDAARSGSDSSSALLARVLPVVSHRIPEMISEGRRRASIDARPAITDALARAERKFSEAVSRLEALSRNSRMADSREIDGLRREREAVLTSIRHASVRLDALRLVVKGDFVG